MILVPPISQPELKSTLKFLRLIYDFISNYMPYSINPSFYHSISPSFHQSIILSFHQSIILSFHQSIILSFHQSIILSFHQSIILSFHQSIIPSVHHSIIPSVHHSIIPSCYSRFSHFSAFRFRKPEKQHLRRSRVQVHPRRGCGTSLPDTTRSSSSCGWSRLPEINPPVF